MPSTGELTDVASVNRAVRDGFIEEKDEEESDDGLRGVRSRARGRRLSSSTIQVLTN